LFNMNGELIGLVKAKSSSSDAEGLGFAIPINDAIIVAQDLLENGYVSGRPYMGITYLAVTDAQTAAQLNVTAYGVYVVDVVQGGPADKAGLKTGDR
ncbi:serine protease HtrA, partial [Faecalibacterium sp. DFI.5.82]|nr:serine protease HtrA [Faecalibacterium sp. DFI.5.82]